MTTKNTEKQNSLRQAIEQNPGVPLEQLAKDNNASTWEIIQCLPENEAVITDADHFESIMQDMSSWGKITFITNANDVILEAKGSLPKGSVAHGYFNMHGPEFGGHIKHDRCIAICFISRQLFGKDSHSVQFYNVDGECMFKVYLGRDDSNQIFPEQIDRFTQLRSAYWNVE